jgi:hypothetical protein
MDIGHPIRRRIIVPRTPARPTVPSPAKRTGEPVPIVPVGERETEPA